MKHDKKPEEVFPLLPIGLYASFPVDHNDLSSDGLRMLTGLSEKHALSSLLFYAKLPGRARAMQKIRNEKP